MKRIFLIITVLSALLYLLPSGMFAASVDTIESRRSLHSIIQRKQQQGKNNIYRAARIIKKAKNANGNIKELSNTVNRRFSKNSEAKLAVVANLRKDKTAFLREQNELLKRSHMIESILKVNFIATPIIGIFLRPVFGTITSGFGRRVHPVFHESTFHSGVDIVSAKPEISASNSGVVVLSGDCGGYGKTVIVNHGNRDGQNISTLYAHLSDITVKKGSFVKRGQTIGYEGSTGYSTGPHLHFEVRVNGKPVNPSSYIK